MQCVTAEFNHTPVLIGAKHRAVSVKSSGPRIKTAFVPTVVPSLAHSAAGSALSLRVQLGAQTCMCVSLMRADVNDKPSESQIPKEERSLMG